MDCSVCEISSHQYRSLYPCQETRLFLHADHCGRLSFMQISHQYVHERSLLLLLNLAIPTGFISSFAFMILLVTDHHVIFRSLPVREFSPWGCIFVLPQYVCVIAILFSSPSLPHHLNDCGHPFVFYPCPLLHIELSHTLPPRGYPSTTRSSRSLSQTPLSRENKSIIWSRRVSTILFHVLSCVLS